ncbi:hypothetical protein SANTM175S_09612 [Streptomyces antimycoticus]
MNRSRKPRIIEPSRPKARDASSGCGSIKALPSFRSSHVARVVFHGFQWVAWSLFPAPVKTVPRLSVRGWVSTVSNRSPS